MLAIIREISRRNCGINFSWGKGGRNGVASYLQCGHTSVDLLKARQTQSILQRDLDELR